MAAFYYTPKTTRTTFLDNLPLNTLNRGLIDALDIARVFVQSDNYFFQGTPFPSAPNVNFTARQAKSGIVTVPALSYILSITADCFATDSADEASNAGFRLRIYDKGAKAETAINAQFMNGKLMSGRFPANASTTKQCQHWLKSPMIIVSPGALQVEITALSSVSTTIQIMLALAIPLSRGSMGETQVQRKTQNGS